MDFGGRRKLPRDRLDARVDFVSVFTVKKYEEEKKSMKKYVAVVVFIAGIFFFGEFGAKAAAPNASSLYNVTTSSLVASGTGTLFSVHITSGAVGDYVVCYDSASTSGVVLSTDSIPSTSKLNELMRVYASSGTNITGPASGFMPSSVPIVNFTNGLVCIQSAPQRTNVYWRSPN